MSVDERAGGWQLVAVVLGSAALAVAAGGLAAVVGYNSGGDDVGGWESLARAVSAVIAAALVGIPVLVVAVIVGVRRTIPPGRRLATAVTILAATVTVPFLIGWATEASRRAGFDVLGLPLAVVFLVSAGAVIGGAAGIVPARRVVTLVGASVVAVGLLAVVVEVRGDEVAEQREVARYERNGSPLALIGGSDLDAGFVGWELRYVDGGHTPGEVEAAYEVVGAGVGDSWLDLVLEAEPPPIDCDRGTCEELGRRSDGRPILGFRPPDPNGAPDGFSDVWVDVDGGRWRVTSTFTDIEPRSAVAVLQALEPVDAETFVAAT